MILSDQTDVINALSNPATYGKNITKVEVKRSHISVIFFVGDYVYKLKRAVVYPGVDFSTPEKRKLSCISEMKRSTVYAPHLIKSVKPVRRLKNGKIKIGGNIGEEIDTVIIEKRLPDKAILSFLLPSVKFDRFETMDLAEHLAELHAKAKTFHTKWGQDDIKNIILYTESVLSCFPNYIDSQKLNYLTQKSLELVEKHKSLINFRQKSGRIRKCHGDLSLSNIAYDKGRFLLFSPIEYNDSLDCTDTLYDLAFLTMDLEARNLRRLSNILINHYMAYINDIEGLPLMGLYQSMRAAYRAAVCAKTSALSNPKEKKNLIRQAKKYFELALHFLTPIRPIVIACGGLAGSGKSRIAREIGGLINPGPGAVILRDVVIKKQITGLAPHQGFNKTVDSPVFEKITYDVLCQQIKSALSAGASVVLDATFCTPQQRHIVQQTAKQMKAPFIGLWMDAPLEVRKNRVWERNHAAQNPRKENELECQLNIDTGPMDWHVINTDMPKEKTMKQVIEILKKHLNMTF